MTKDDAKKIIYEEELKNFNWFEERNTNPDEVGIKKTNHEWLVYSTDERACVRTEIAYQKEEDALIDFIDRLRGDKMMREAYLLRIKIK